uniref:Sugar transporter SWEET1 n=1 Tax=Craspedostauros australis TaxID=1486917 RepID=A0A7R9WUL4_9STRA|mmetsp:Transcript_18669/g.51919  ORF Transcript_18669/g.51919 Transcript_18669/m.51919 type:complete len:214 (+) Transcript_18669:1095-1736(+)
MPHCAIPNHTILQPMPTINQIAKDKSIGSLPLLPYTTMIASSFLWVAYGVLKSESKIWSTNILGMVLGTYYFTQYIKWIPKKMIPDATRDHYRGITGIILATLAIAYVLPIQDPSTVVGNIAVLFCMILFGSPLIVLRSAIRDRSAKSLPLPFTIATIINCFLWSVLGWFDMNDVNVYFPNLVGLSFGLCQLILKLVFGDGVAAPENRLDSLL